MAGAGYKKWNTGALLLASDLNTYLADQVVQVYASDAARTAAIGTSIAEGMASYRADGKIVEYYNGSSWVGLLDTNDLIVNPRYYGLSSDRNLTSGTTIAQSVLGVGYSLAASTTYEIELVASISYAQTTTTSLQLSTAFAYSGTLTSQTLKVTSSSPSSTSLLSTNSEGWTATTTPGQLFVINSDVVASTKYNTLTWRGLVRTNTAGTFTPQLVFSGTNFNTAVVKANSFMRVNPLGSNTGTNFAGAWV